MGTIFQNFFVEFHRIQARGQNGRVVLKTVEGLEICRRKVTLVQFSGLDIADIGNDVREIVGREHDLMM